MRKIVSLLILAILFYSCIESEKKAAEKDLAEKITNNEYFPLVKTKAMEVMKSGFNAGDGYREVWIRDYNTFIELAAQVFPKEELKEIYVK